MDAIIEGSPINDPKKHPAAMRCLLGQTARDWWPESLLIDILHQKGVANQKEVRPQAELGGPFHPRRERRDRVDGRADLRFLRWSRGRVRAREGRVLAHRGGMARPDSHRRGTGLALESPLAAIQHGLIHVNPEGPGGCPHPQGSARDIKETFARMGMNDEEPVALTASGHAFVKAHVTGARRSSLVGKEPEGSDIASQGLGWTSSHGSGMGDHTITSGIEGAWTPTPTTWDMTYFDMPFDHEYELVKSRRARTSGNRSPIPTIRWLARRTPPASAYRR